MIFFCVLTVGMSFCCILISALCSSPSSSLRHSFFAPLYYLSPGIFCVLSFFCLPPSLPVGIPTLTSDLSFFYGEQKCSLFTKPLKHFLYLNLLMSSHQATDITMAEFRGSPYNNKILVLSYVNM